MRVLASSVTRIGWFFFLPRNDIPAEFPILLCRELSGTHSHVPWWYETVKANVIFAQLLPVLRGWEVRSLALSQVLALQSQPINEVQKPKADWRALQACQPDNLWHPVTSTALRSQEDF